MGRPARPRRTVDTGPANFERKANLIERITHLGPERMDEVCRALAFATGC